MKLNELVRRKKIPGLFLKNKVRLHEELDAQPQPTRGHVVHLLADAVPQIQPQVLAFAAGELQPKVVHLDDAQLPAHLEGNKWRIRTNKKDEDASGGGPNLVLEGPDPARISITDKSSIRICSKRLNKLQSIDCIVCSRTKKVIDILKPPEG